jgi:chromosomal replication initiation ATPase DnaA
LKQLSFNLQTTENINPYDAENFVELEENHAAINFLQKFFTQTNFSQSQFKSLILKGSTSSGKTHLSHIFAKKSLAEFLQISEISRQNLTSLFAANHFYILEDINKIQNEELLLHLINSASEAKAFLLLTSQNKNEFHLKDLTSRIKNIFSLKIKDPSSKTIEILLVNAFSRRQIKVSSRIINFISSNIARDYQAIFDTVNLIELSCGENKRKLTLRVVKEILNNTKPHLATQT